MAGMEREHCPDWHGALGLGRSGLAGLAEVEQGMIWQERFSMDRRARLGMAGEPWEPWTDAAR